MERAALRLDDVRLRPAVHNFLLLLHQLHGHHGEPPATFSQVAELLARVPLADRVRRCSQHGVVDTGKDINEARRRSDVALGCGRTRRLRLRGGNLAAAAMPRAPTIVTLTVTATATTTTTTTTTTAAPVRVRTTAAPVHVFCKPGALACSTTTTSAHGHRFCGARGGCGAR